MRDEDFELLITTDDPGEDDLEEDTFHRQPKNTGQPLPHAADTTSEET